MASWCPHCHRRKVGNLSSTSPVEDEPAGGSIAPKDSRVGLLGEGLLWTVAAQGDTLLLR